VIFEKFHVSSRRLAVDATQRRRNFSQVAFTVTFYGRVSTMLVFEKLHVSSGRLGVCVAVCCSATYATVLRCNTRCIAQHNTFCCMARHVVLHCNTRDGVAPATRMTLRNGGASSRISPKAERWGAGVETQKNVRGEIGGWSRVPFNEPYAPLLSTIYDGA